MKRKNSQPKIWSEENAKQALFCSRYQERKLPPGFSGNGNYQTKASKVRYPKNLYFPLWVFFHSFPRWNLDGMITPLILRHHLWHKVMQYFRMEGNLRHPNFHLFNLAFSLAEKKKNPAWPFNHMIIPYLYPHFIDNIACAIHLMFKWQSGLLNTYVPNSSSEFFFRQALSLMFFSLHRIWQIFPKWLLDNN